METDAEEVPRMEAEDDDDPPPRTPQDVFRNIRGRRAAILKALTTDVEDLYQQCDPAKENLSLYGYPNEEWRVGPPPDAVPTIIPEPVLGINFARDGMDRKEWLAFIAAHSDSWLLAVANVLGSTCCFGKSERIRVFNMLNDLPTITEVVTGTTKKEKPSSSNQRRKKSNCKGKGKRVRIRSKKVDKENICGACGDVYVLDEFWIFCDSCETWFHGKCVEVSPDMAELIDFYECPACSNKSARQ